LATGQTTNKSRVEEAYHFWVNGGLQKETHKGKSATAEEWMEKPVNHAHKLGSMPRYSCELSEADSFKRQNIYEQ
jgi:hypothetical protein